MSRRSLFPLVLAALTLAMAACASATAPTTTRDCSGGVIAGSGNCMR